MVMDFFSLVILGFFDACEFFFYVFYPAGKIIHFLLHHIQPFHYFLGAYNW